MSNAKYSSLQELANHEVWPHCAEGMGVDGDEVTARLITEGRITWSPEGMWVNITPEQVEAYVASAYEKNRG